jgi:hypothetical protein
MDESPVGEGLSNGHHSDAGLPGACDRLHDPSPTFRLPGIERLTLPGVESDRWWKRRSWTIAASGVDRGMFLLNGARCRRQGRLRSTAGRWRRNWRPSVSPQGAFALVLEEQSPQMPVEFAVHRPPIDVESVPAETADDFGRGDTRLLSKRGLNSFDERGIATNWPSSVSCTRRRRGDSGPRWGWPLCSGGRRSASGALTKLLDALPCSNGQVPGRISRVRTDERVDLPAEHRQDLARIGLDTLISQANHEFIAGKTGSIEQKFAELLKDRHGTPRWSAVAVPALNGGHCSRSSSSNQRVYGNTSGHGLRRPVNAAGGRASQR